MAFPHPLGPVFTAMKQEMVDCEEAFVIQDYLFQASIEGHQYFTDGCHLRSAGIQAMAPAVKSLAARFAADVVLSDSCLCAREDWWKDRVACSSCRLS